jgi:hypothetical protein
LSLNKNDKPFNSGKTLTLVRGLLLFSALGLLFTGCAAVNEDTRAKMNPGEGKFTYLDSVDMSRDKIYDKLMEWIALNYASFQEVQQFQKKEQRIIAIKALAPIAVYGKQRHINYQLSIRIANKKIRMEFITNAMTDGTYPSMNSLKKLEQHYQKMRATILGVLGAVPSEPPESAAKPVKPAPTKTAKAPKPAPTPAPAALKKDAGSPAGSGLPGF